jgi:phosphoribosylamine--glycine ligase
LYLFKGIRMKILVVGSGGREHALAWVLAKSPNTEVFALPGNPGSAAVAQCLPSADLSPRNILAAAQSLNVDLTVIGPEAPLVAGVVDMFKAAGRPIIGPTAENAQLEGSKVYAKNFFREHRIPTAEFETVDNPLDARRAIDRFGFPVVIKTDGLAAGKGVVIAHDLPEAEDAIRTLGPTLVIEEFLTGPEVSFIVLSDGKDVVPLLPARDHKRIFDGDQGPNTGGMGAFCDPGLLTPLETAQILETIIWPTVEATHFTGFLYAGLIMTPNGPKLLEYNVRMGDPETQPLMNHLNMNFAEVLLATSQGRLGVRELNWHPGSSAAVVLAAEGYPGQSRFGDLIVGIDKAKVLGAQVFQAGTKVGWGGLRTAGGRVLAVTASGPTLQEALTKTYAAVDKIHFRGMQFRRDIGRKSANQLS